MFLHLIISKSSVDIVCVFKHINTPQQSEDWSGFGHVYLSSSMMADLDNISHWKLLFLSLFVNPYLGAIKK